MAAVEGVLVAQYGCKTAKKKQRQENPAERGFCERPRLERTRRCLSCATTAVTAAAARGCPKLALLPRVPQWGPKRGLKRAKTAPDARKTWPDEVQRDSKKTGILAPKLRCSLAPRCPRANNLSPFVTASSQNQPAIQPPASWTDRSRRPNLESMLPRGRLLSWAVRSLRCWDISHLQCKAGRMPRREVGSQNISCRAASAYRNTVRRNSRQVTQLRRRKRERGRVVSSFLFHAAIPSRREPWFGLVCEDSPERFAHPDAEDRFRRAKRLRPTLVRQNGPSSNAQQNTTIASSVDSAPFRPSLSRFTPMVRKALAL
ncbi:hypothetical protein QBC34DRAFT_98195 [Podospora aff. communis PSN243]|uniref:Uncharacterized protein n=1 Tax=Podospora aff. communis PSN243 TaxID=3040156 RepID=A0AAV9GKP0_9PEZI|nr:hypothetical protein QBC34DRAFT_98195 [Podospora aff. communis PSN243]